MVLREGGAAYIHKFVQEWIFKLIVYCLETPKFVVTTNWLQLSPFAVWKPKHCKYYHHSNLILIILNNLFVWSKHYFLIDIIVL